MDATYLKTGKQSWRVVLHWRGQRQYKSVHSEADAKALVQFVHKQELAGVNVIEAIRTARAPIMPAGRRPALLMLDSRSPFRKAQHPRLGHTGFVRSLNAHARILAASRRVRTPHHFPLAS